MIDDKSTNNTTINQIDNDYSNELSSFPTKAFPKTIQSLIHELSICASFPEDYLGTAILYATSIAFGNTYCIKLSNVWKEHGALYFALVGNPGDYKTPSINTVLQPIRQLENANANKYAAERATYEKQLREFQKAKASQQNVDEPVRPVLRKIIFKDFTMEALLAGHSYNPRGIGIHSDELLGLIGDFDRYTKGGDQKKLLSIWSRDTISVDRKGGEPIYIANPFISMIGGIQIQLLKELARQNRRFDGFIDRILFAFPDDFARKPLSSYQVSDVLLEKWEQIINMLFSLPEERDTNGNIHPREITYTEDAYNVYRIWYNQNVTKINSVVDDKGIHSKLDISINRIALIIQLLKFACAEGSLENVDKSSIESAILLVEYYRNSAEKVRLLLNNIEDKFDNKKIEFLNLLPAEFTTSQAYEIYKNNIAAPGASDQSITKAVQRFIQKNRGVLFSCISHGVYSKTIDKAAVKISLVPTQANIPESSDVKPQKVLEIWNDWAKEHKKPVVRALSSIRLQHINARLKEKAFDINEILQYASQSSFILRETFFDFEWLFSSPNNYLKVIEGKYADKDKSCQLVRNKENDW